MGGESDSEVEEERIGEGSAGGSESESDHDSVDDLQEQVADIPFDALQKARADGGSNRFAGSKGKLDTKRANKNRPMEISSKKPVPRFREVIQAPKRVIRDPRFESLCGNFEESRFKTTYSFLYDEQLPQERKRLQKALKKKGAHDDLETKLAWINQQLKEEDERRKENVKKTQNKSMEIRAVKQGKKPFYFKKSDLRKQELVEKFKELKSSGKLDTYMAKRRRKNASKDHRFLPYRRNAD